MNLIKRVFFILGMFLLIVIGAYLITFYMIFFRPNSNSKTAYEVAEEFTKFEISKNAVVEEFMDQTHFHGEQNVFVVLNFTKNEFDSLVSQAVKHEYLKTPIPDMIKSSEYFDPNIDGLYKENTDHYGGRTLIILDRSKRRLIVSYVLN